LTDSKNSYGNHNFSDYFYYLFKSFMVSDWLTANSQLRNRHIYVIADQIWSFYIIFNVSDVIALNMKKYIQRSDVITLNMKKSYSTLS
jgi:hypothetical protein